MAHLGSAGSALPFLVILRILTDRAGCYNVRGKKLIVRKLTSTVNSSGIATFSVCGEGLRFFDFLKCMNTIFRGFHTFMVRLCCNGLVFSLFMLLVTLSMLTDGAGCYNVREKKLIVRIYIYRQFLWNCHLLRARRRSTLF